MTTYQIKHIDSDSADGIVREWYEISGTANGWEFEGTETFALTSNGAILNEDGYPLTEGDRQTIAARNAIENA